MGGKRIEKEGIVCINKLLEELDYTIAGYLTTKIDKEFMIRLFDQCELRNDRILDLSKQIAKLKMGVE